MRDVNSLSSAVKMQNISKSFGGIKALDNVDISFQYHEIHALLGENGAGKSTILKILRGIHSFSNGKVLIDNNPISP